MVRGSDVNALKLFCLEPGDEDVKYSSEKMASIDGSKRWGRDTIAPQCCTSKNWCRRRVGGECIAGHSEQGFPWITPMTWGEAATFCVEMGFTVCKKACNDVGCGYNKHPVYTNISCDASPPPVPPIPETGAMVLRGDDKSEKPAPLACLMPGDDARKYHVESTDNSSEPYGRNTIAAQCCTVRGWCHRKFKNECISGFSSDQPPHIEPMTWGENAQLCESYGLYMCKKSCVDDGCGYNKHPVYTGIPCTPDDVVEYNPDDKGLA